MERVVTVAEVERLERENAELRDLLAEADRILRLYDIGPRLRKRIQAGIQAALG